MPWSWNARSRAAQRTSKSSRDKRAEHLVQRLVVRARLVGRPRTSRPRRVRVCSRRGGRPPQPVYPPQVSASFREVAGSRSTRRLACRRHRKSVRAASRCRLTAGPFAVVVEAPGSLGGLDDVAALLAAGAAGSESGASSVRRHDRDRRRPPRRRRHRHRGGSSSWSRCARRCTPAAPIPPTSGRRATGRRTTSSSPRSRQPHPDDAVLSEEGADDPVRLGAERVWIVDPLDGTREFGEEGRTDWAVHVALDDRRAGGRGRGRAPGARPHAQRVAGADASRPRTTVRRASW